MPYKKIEQALQAENNQAEFAAVKEEFLYNLSYSLNELKTKDLALSDSLAEKVYTWSQTLNVPDREQAPLLVLLEDIPPIAAFALRIIYKTGLCYGYDLETPEDYRYMLEALYKIAGHPHVKPGNSLLGDNTINLRHIARHIGTDLTFRKFLVQYPYLRNAVGTSASRWYFRDAASAAQRIFQKRWLIDNKKWL